MLFGAQHHPRFRLARVGETYVGVNEALVPPAQELSLVLVVAARLSGVETDA
jgi:hypothetical protein